MADYKPRVEEIQRRGERTTEGIRKCKKDTTRVSFAEPLKMFSSHRTDLVSINYLESVI